MLCENSIDKHWIDCCINWCADRAGLEDYRKTDAAHALYVTLEALMHRQRYRVASSISNRLRAVFLRPRRCQSPPLQQSPTTTDRL